MAPSTRSLRLIVFTVSTTILLYSVTNTIPILSLHRPAFFDIFGAVPAPDLSFSPEQPFGGYKFLPNHTSPHSSSQDYHEWNEQTQEELDRCVALANCGPNQQKVALLAAHSFEDAIMRGGGGDQGIWAASIYKNLRSMGYSTFFANSFEEALRQYRKFPDLVRVVIRNTAAECHADPQCVKSPSNPTGIPAWKIFDFEYIPSPTAGHYHASLLGWKWILSGIPDSKIPSPIQYIGFSVEEECKKISAVRLVDRPNRAWMFVDQLTYVYDSSFAWNRSYFSLGSTETSLDHLQFFGAWEVNQYFQWNPKEKGEMEDVEERSKGVVNLISKKEGNSTGKLRLEEWGREVAQSKVMVGMGNPPASVAPYYALCLGVPFINPILQWAKDDPWNKRTWKSQHMDLQGYEPPYVYHVHAHNYTGFVEAIRLAFATEFTGFIPKYMTEKAVRQRLRTLMETDWRTEGKHLLDERLKEQKLGRKPYMFEL